MRVTAGLALVGAVAALAAGCGDAREQAAPTQSVPAQSVPTQKVRQLRVALVPRVGGPAGRVKFDGLERADK